MAVIRKFKAIRPTSEMAEAVAALPYDVVNSEEAREMTKDKPYSFLHVDKAEIDLPVDTDIYSPQVYAKAKENLDKLVSDGILVQDNKSMLYVYELTMDGRSQTGLVACTSIDEYLNGIIKKHELIIKCIFYFLCTDTTPRFSLIRCHSQMHVRNMYKPHILTSNRIKLLSSLRIHHVSDPMCSQQKFTPYRRKLQHTRY